MTKTAHIVIIGNGIAGVSACSAIRAANADIPITLVSDENTVAYSAPVLAYYLGGDIPRSRVFIRKPEDYQQSKIDTRFGQKVTGLDLKACKLSLNGHSVGFDRLILATGAGPMMPSIRGIGLKGIFTFKTLADIDGLSAHQPKKVVVAGAGPVGIEAAIALKKMGAEVTLIATRWVAPRAFDEKPANLIQRELEKNGVVVVNSERVQAIKGDSKVEGVVTEKRSLECDTVIMAAGMKPETGLAEKAGVKLGQLGGIAVDETMATSIEGVYACGDCVETTDALTGKKALNMLWSNARVQARAAGLNCLGGKEKYAGSINVRALNVFGLAASAFGYSASVLDGKNVQVIEKDTAWGYYRVIFHEGKMVGGQWVGAIRDTGALMAAVRSHGPMASFDGNPGYDNFALSNPLWTKVARYMPAGKSKIKNESSK